MKFVTIASSAALFGAAAVFAAEAPVSMDQVVSSVQNVEKPAGVEFIGTAEPLKKPEGDMVKDKDSKQEWFGWGGLGRWGWGGRGWGGFFPYRWGFNYGGLGGWAYPLGYWNTWGAGLYGGGCGLGLAYGGLYYC